MSADDTSAPNSSNTPNQAGYQDDQNYEIDISQIYSDWITPIDNIRSFTNILNNKRDLENIGKTVSITGLSKLLKMEKTVQESRCHAFFRMIGLPVVADNKSFFSPGLDLDISRTGRTIDLDKKTAIAQNPIEGFNQLSEARETFVNDNLQVFSTPTSVTAGVLALSSGGTKKVRPFIAPLDKNTTALDVKKVSDQSYDVNLDGLVGKNKVISLTEYQDQFGDSPKDNHPEFVGEILTKRTHIIKPFIVDARIELTVSPQSRLMAIPFVLEVAQTKVSATENVARPVLEKIIRDRITSTNAAETIGTNITAIRDYIKNVPAIKDENLVNLVQTDDVYKQSDANKFINSVNTIRAMVSKLVEAQKIIRAAQGFYYWLPQPASTGPEGGSTVPPVFIPTAIDPKLVTAADIKILISFAKSVTANPNSESATQLSFPVPTTTFGADTASGLGDNNAQNSETLTQARKRVLGRASDALRTIEVIMGEFSGLGLCDIIAVISALNIMDKTKLVGLLDDDAYQRMLISMKLTTSSAPRHEGIEECLQELTDRVKDYYNLMDKVYKDISVRNGIS